MFNELIKRENTIFNILQQLINAKLYFILIGGYGISAYKHRFSVDADLVIYEKDKERFEEMLKKNKFVKTITKKLNHIYTNEFLRYETKEKFNVSVDLLINGVGSRNTDASYSIEELGKYCMERKIIGTEKEINAIVPNKEILIVLKLHAGRLTDFRDVVALSKNIDVNLINSLIWRGDKELVKINIKKLFSLVSKKEFIDAFKGVFIEKKYDIDLESLNKLKQLI
ncbi:nucleotidyl transferase AbiEii/AbiGii toxin family protein [Candidatus Woesearchaeota archaeon]|nr:nucleotidyl transferase AbiEii/AbiGii toxin family protein [Candidatus Woesearchaeota archaeon]